MRSNIINKIELWSGISCAIFGLGYIIPTLLSIFKIITYSENMIFFYIPSILLAPIFLILMICLHYSAPKNKRIFTAIGLNFAAIYCVFSSIAYFIPLTTLLSAYISNNGISHNLNITVNTFLNAVNHLAYVFMSLSTFVAAYAFKKDKRLFQGLWANGVLAPLIILAYINPKLYYLEALWFISFPFLMITVALYFKNQSVSKIYNTEYKNKLQKEYYQ